MNLPFVKQKLHDEYRRKLERSEVQSSDVDRLMFSRKAPRARKGVCWNCGSSEHFQNKCPQPKKFRSAETRVAVEDTVEVARLSRIVDVEDEAVALMVANHKVDDAWYLDSGCTKHMTHSKKVLTRFRTHGRTKIFMANGQSIGDQGTGEAMIRCEVGGPPERVLKLEDLLLVPELNANLLSISQLVKKGFKVGV